MTKANWTRPNKLVLDQNHFGPIEGQGIIVLGTKCGGPKVQRQNVSQLI
jgi:hypothetical protein